MNDFEKASRGVDPDFFSLGVRRALSAAGPEESDTPYERYADDPLSDLADQFVAGEFASWLHPEVVEAGAEVAEAESAVLAAEDAGVTDELAMRRLERARVAERAVLVRLQKRRAIAHTRQAESRVAQVVPMRPALRVVVGGEAA